MIHPSTEVRYINDKIGYGVIATQFIPKGTITWAIDKLDRIFTPDQVRGMEPIYKEVLDKYSYRNADGNHVLCWDNARFVNHSSNSNCITTAYEFELAVRDIYPGEELTDDYGYLNIEEPFDVLPEQGTNRTTLYPDDPIRYYHIWDKKLVESFMSLLRVDQPLVHLLSTKLKEKVTRIAEGKEQMDSILNCYCDIKKLNGHAQELINVRVPNVVYPF